LRIVVFVWLHTVQGGIFGGKGGAALAIEPPAPYGEQPVTEGGQGKGIGIGPAERRFSTIWASGPRAVIGLDMTRPDFPTTRTTTC
jgi:hypothetical protein